MKTYEPATLIDLGNASDLVLGDTGFPGDTTGDVSRQILPTLLDVDE